MRACVLVLSAYEPTTWHIVASQGANILGVHLIGYEDQQLASDSNAAVLSRDVGAEGACGYSWPYNGQGCDTDKLLALARQRAGTLSAFHGCYRATTWKEYADGAVASDCAVDDGYQEYSANLCEAEPAPSTWQPATFTTATPATYDGERYVRFDESYGLWVGAILCGSNDHYKLYLSDDPQAPFLQIADYAGHGQDRCELVNPAFTSTRARRSARRSSA